MRSRQGLEHARDGHDSLLSSTAVSMTAVLRPRASLRLERKGGRGDRTVLTAPVTGALDAYLDGRTTGPIFVTKAGKRMGQPEAWKMVRRIALRASLDGAAQIRPHSLRVAFITGAREAGVPPGGRARRYRTR